MAEKTNKKSGTLDRYYLTKTWKKSKHSLLSQEEIEHRIYNDLPLDDLLDKAANKYKKDKDNGDEKM